MSYKEGIYTFFKVDDFGEGSFVSINVQFFHSGVKFHMLKTFGKTGKQKYHGLDQLSSTLTSMD